MAYYDLVDPVTAKDLRKYIWYGRGGIKRDRDYWDSRLTYSENSRNHAWLDRRPPHGVAMDVLADEIASNFPWYGIHDTEELFAWLGRNPG